MGFWDGFAKYVGVQGVAFIALTGGFIAAPFVGVVLPEGYTELMTLSAGFYFAKNGVGIISAARGVQ